MNGKKKKSNHRSICPTRRLHGALHGAYNDGRRAVLGSDLNLQIDVGKRGAQFTCLCPEFGLITLNSLFVDLTLCLHACR